MINPQNSINSANLLNESSSINLVHVTINDIAIKDEYIQDIEIKYTGNFIIKGYIVINDIYDIQTQGFIEPGQILNIHIIDAHKDDFNRDFVIIRSTETKIQDSKGVTFIIQDIASWKLQNTYIPKSWKKTTLVDVFNYMFEITTKELVPNIKIKTQETRTRYNFCVPLNINFLDFISEEFRKEGIFFYQTKTEIIIGNFDVPETPEYPYKQTGAKDRYGFVIMEYYLVFNNIYETNKILPRTDFISYNPDTKSVQIYDNDLNDYTEQLKLSGIVKPSQLTIGTKHSTQEYLFDTTKFKYIQYKNNTQVTIFVPGNVKYSELYKPIDIYLSGSVYADDTRERGDYKLSGKYMIMEIQDKIALGQKFIQKLLLKRVEEQPKQKGLV